MFDGYEARGILSAGGKGLVKIIIGLAVVLAIIGLAVGVYIGRASANDLTGSQVITIERADDGEMYAALSIVLDFALTQTLSLVAIHDQAGTWSPGFEDFLEHRREWDAGLAWRPTPNLSISAGRRWRVDPPPDYGGPYTYVQLWRGF